MPIALAPFNPWPRPLQQPHPPIWIPGVGSLETIEFVAQRRYAYMGIPYFPIEVFRKVFALFRDACSRAGYEAKPEQMGWGDAASISSALQPLFLYRLKVLDRYSPSQAPKC